MTAYGFADKILHRIVLQSRLTAECLFDLEQKMYGADPRSIVNQRHVFISGLARSGSTALMRAFYASGAFRSLTYQDMPFVLAPNLWRLLSQNFRKQTPLTERAHADGILVNADSPESLDEVFWKQFDGCNYIKNDHLLPHAPKPEMQQKFARYINSILKAQNGTTQRYLSKNNNNILRLDSIRSTFPQALILIPFRSPTAQAHSLLRQHLAFTKKQRQDSFVRSYMSWLGHYEFGLDHKPFLPTTPVHDPNSPEYWLDLWHETYAWLEVSAPDDAIWVCYENLCSQPDVWTKLARLAGLENSDPPCPFQAQTTPDDTKHRTYTLYQRLQQKTRIN